MNTQLKVLDVEPRRQSSLRKLIETSNEEPMDLLTSLPWSIGVDRAKPPKKVRQGWLTGTRFDRMLTPEQRHELLWLENARDASMFISLEQTLPVIYVGYLTQHDRVLTPEVRDYLTIFSKEELVHIMTFRRYLETAGLPLYGPERSTDFALQQLPQMPPIFGILFTLIVEWVAEQGAMSGTQSAEVDPLTRALYRRHHVDEARHIAFARWVVESHFARAPEDELEQLRTMAKPLHEQMIQAYTFNPGIANYTSFPYPVDIEDEAQVREVTFSEANLALNAKRFKPLNDWLAKVGLT
jgi:P-aminobenzoate N-oxygenase AurF